MSNFIYKEYSAPCALCGNQTLLYESELDCRVHPECLEGFRAEWRYIQERKRLDSRT